MSPLPLALNLSLALLAAPAVDAPAARPAVKSAPNGPRVTAVTTGAPRVEVAFVLDTTGSMGGLIEGAKRKIWAIARQIGEGRPRPELRIALVAYRDRGDAYVTRVFDLSPDMDDVYASLRSLQADGGGDGPEHVSAALHDAVHGVSWSRGRALRMIFLVGDAPPHLDYQDGFDYRRHVQEARQRGIFVDAVQCGAWGETTRFWQEVAAAGGGRFVQIDASGGMPARVTPADAELAKLNAELAATVVAAGSAREREDAARKLDARAAMPAPAAAEAAGYFAKAGRLAETDLVGLSLPEQKRQLAALRAQPQNAPPALAGKTEADALGYLRQRQARRAEIQGRIAELVKQREEHLARAAGEARDGFDAQVARSLKDKAAASGIRY